MLRSGDQPVPDYTLQHYLGCGRFGEVWSSLAPGRVRAALKIIQLEGQQGLKEYNSIQRIKNVQHPHLLPINALWLLDENGEVIDTDQYEGEQDTWTTEELAKENPRPAMLVLAMPLSDKSLFEVLEQHRHAGLKGIPPEELLGYLEEVAKGLDFLNYSQLDDSEIGVQHCDIKPHNILLMGNSALICDFGLAHVLNDGGSSSAQIAVSPAYAAPECLRHNQPSSTSDQYSLAITYYELRTGELPFACDSAANVYDAHLQGNLNLKDISAAEQNVLHRATALDPSDRFPTTTGMVRVLRSALNLQAGSDIRATIVEPTKRAFTKTVVASNPLDEQTSANPTEEFATVKLSPQEALAAQYDSRITSLESSVAATNPDSGFLGFMKWKKNKVLFASGLVALLLVVAIFGISNTNDDQAQAEKDDDSPRVQQEQMDPDEVPETAETKPATAETDAEDLQLLSLDEHDAPAPLVEPRPKFRPQAVPSAGAAETIQSATAFFQRGNSFSRQRKDAQAIAEYTKAINLNPADALLMYKLYNRRAVAYRKMKNENGDQHALDDFSEAARYASDNKKKARLYYARGTLLKDKNRLTEAIEDFTQTVGLWPDDPLGYQGRAEVYRLRKSPGDENRADQDELQIRILKGEKSSNSA